MTDFLHNRFVQGALTGLVSAVVVDLHAFTTWKSFNDAAVYDYKTAALRWLQGTVAGLVTAGGISLAA